MRVAEAKAAVSNVLDAAEYAKGFDDRQRLSGGRVLEEKPFIGLVPKDFYANLEFRRQLLIRAEDDRKFQHGLRVMCQHDILFYVNAFGWTYDPREDDCKELPFITWEFQDQAFLEVKRAIGHYDLFLEKSRTMGASWIIVTGLEHVWHFVKMARCGLISRNEGYVDDTENPKSLFWKIDFLHGHQPRWLLPPGRWRGAKDPNRKKMHLLNADLGGTIDGEACTGDCFRGDRLGVIMLDEFASFPQADGFKADDATKDATNCRIINSTPKGPGNAFHRMAKSQDYKKLRLYWPQHPIQRAGLYRITEGGHLEILDRDYWDAKIRESGEEVTNNPTHYRAQCRRLYHFVTNDIELPLRSPWFDGECRRATRRATIFQEQEIRYDAAASPFFPLGDLTKMSHRYAIPVLQGGELDFEAQSLRPTEFAIREAGRLGLWFRLDASGEPPMGDYVIGADIAAAASSQQQSGLSNSALAVGNRNTKELVAMYAVSGMDPTVFAERAIVLARWFHNAHLIWEANGPGIPFGNRIIEHPYLNIYMRRDETKLFKRSIDAPGWWTSPKTKYLLLSELQRAIHDQSFAIRSQITLEECEHYQYSSNSSIVHSGSLGEDPSGARENHGDRVIALALCWWKIRGERDQEDRKKSMPTHCAAARFADAEEEERDRKRNRLWDYEDVTC